MTQMVTDLFKREARGEKMCSARVSQAMRAAIWARDAQHSETASHKPIHVVHRQWAERSFECQKKLPAGRARPNLLKVTQDDVTHYWYQRIVLCAPKFGPCNAKYFTFPVDILQSQL
jgi:hypothetical protein